MLIFLYLEEFSNRFVIVCYMKFEKCNQKFILRTKVLFQARTRLDNECGEFWHGRVVRVHYYFCRVRNE